LVAVNSITFHSTAVTVFRSASDTDDELLCLHDGEDSGQPQAAKARPSRKRDVSGFAAQPLESFLLGRLSDFFVGFRKGRIVSLFEHLFGHRFARAGVPASADSLLP